MKYYPTALLFYFLSLSCYNSSSKENNDLSLPKQTLQPELFDCDYVKCKASSHDLYKQYKKKPDSISKQALINQVRDSLFACWYGTAWDFNGITEEPGMGNIACGYFVTTILRDMGMPVERYKHAQMASEDMINAICIKNNITRYVNVDSQSFVEKMKIKGTGLYIVGLDFHTGFILNDGQEVYFVHSNYAGKKVVMSEIAGESAVLASSKVKMVGKVI